jgi:hypothetical protein
MKYAMSCYDASSFHHDLHFIPLHYTYVPFTSLHFTPLHLTSLHCSEEKTGGTNRIKNSKRKKLKQESKKTFTCSQRLGRGRMICGKSGNRE